MSTARTFRLGVTLYSFTTEYRSFQWSFEDCMRKAAELGPRMGIEIVGPQHHRGFPEVPKEFERMFKSSCERNGLIPTSYGSYADAYFWPDRDFTPDELVDYTIPQLKGAARLGFPVVRLQYNVAPVIERLLPYAKKYKLKMGYEIHTPLMFENPTCQELIRHVKKISSEHLGFVPDCGIFELPSGRPSGSPEGEMPKPSNPRALADIMPYIFHVHGKFHRMIDGEVPDVPFDEIVRVLIEGGFQGWMVTEFEGSNLGSYPNSFEIVKAHHALIRRYIAKHARA